MKAEEENVAVSREIQSEHWNRLGHGSWKDDHAEKAFINEDAKSMKSYIIKTFISDTPLKQDITSIKMWHY